MTAVASAPVIAAAPAPTDDEIVDDERRRRGVRVSMRWKLLLAFGVCITVVFVLVAIWIVRFTTDTANRRLSDTLRGISIGGAEVIDPEAFRALTLTSPAPVPGSVYPADAGLLSGTKATATSLYPTDPLYWQHVNQLLDIRRTNPEASTYTYFRDADGNMEFIGSWSALGYPTPNVDPPIGTRFHQPVSDLVSPDTATYFAQGLDQTTQEPQYTDLFGTWISAYTPIRDANGVTIGGFGVDYPVSYVDQVQSRVVHVLYPVLGAAYLVLAVLVIYLSHWMTRRLGRLTSATRRVSAGEYDIDLTRTTKAVFPDEMTELAQSFTTMTERIEARERSLVRQVQVLKVEIDETRRQEAVAEITESDFFSSLTAKAAVLRAKVRDQEAAEAAEAAHDSDTDTAEPPAPTEPTDTID